MDGTCLVSAWELLIHIYPKIGLHNFIVEDFLSENSSWIGLGGEPLCLGKEIMKTPSAEPFITAKHG